MKKEDVNLKESRQGLKRGKKGRNITNIIVI